MEKTQVNERFAHIIFGFKEVLIEWDPSLALEGLYPKGVISMVLDPQDEWGFWRYKHFSEIGWSEEKILSEYELTHGPAVAWVLKQYFEHYRHSLKQMVPGMSAVLSSLQSQGIHLWGLTNSSSKDVKAMLDSFKPLRAFEGIIVSAEECLRKPDPLIYQLALHRFDINAEQTIVVDHDIDHVRAANKLGLHGLLFTGAQKLASDLQTLGINCSTPAVS